MKNLLKIAALTATVFLAAHAQAQHSHHPAMHEMQHGFVLATDDSFASHLVASGHHSRQTEILGQLTIEDSQELEVYQNRRLQNTSEEFYYLFQAQTLDLPTLKAGQILTGHIVESKVGDYQPKNVIVRKATYKVERVLLNMANPFFGDQ